MVKESVARTSVVKSQGMPDVWVSDYQLVCVWGEGVGTPLHKKRLHVLAQHLCIVSLCP
jgi:hypothetical protein